MMNIDWKKVGLFAGGVLFGTAGVKVLASKDAKKRMSAAPQQRFVPESP